MPTRADHDLRARAAGARTGGGRTPLSRGASRERRRGAGTTRRADVGVHEAAPLTIGQASKPQLTTRSTRTSTITDDPSSIGDDDSYCGNFSYSNVRSLSNSNPE